MLRAAQCEGCIGSRSAHNCRIEHFWREHNVKVMIHFKKVFEKLEYLGHLDTYDNTDLWALNSVFILDINKRID